ncbi:MAG: ATP-binding protein, partial [Dehalococcoidia bacterium]
AKLILSGVSASIVALSIVAVVAYFITRDAITDTAMNGLTSIATTQRQQIESTFSHFEIGVESIANDTQIRRLLRRFWATSDPLDRLVLNQTLTDRAVNDGHGGAFDLHSLDGQIVASSEPGHIGPSTYDPTQEGVIISVGLVGRIEGVQNISLSTPVIFDGRTIGYATIHHTSAELDQIVTRHLGRGNTGETLLITLDENGAARFVTSLRFNENGDYYKSIDDGGEPTIEILSLSGSSGSGTRFVDYRSQNVFGVYHYIETAKVGLVVKIDSAEALAPVVGLGRGLIAVIFVVSIAIVVSAIVISNHMIEPISRLTSAAEQFSRGKLNARVLVEHTDEIGILSETFNIMAGSLQAANDELECRVEERTADLKRSNQDLEQFAYVASHDLQEPLRMVSSYTQLLSKRYSGRLDSDADDFIGFAVDGAKRMQTLINDLLIYSREGRREHEYVKIDTNSLVKGVLNNLKDRIDKVGSIVNFSDLPVVVADEQQLVSVFQNLIGNSIKYRSASRNSVIDITAKRSGSGWRFMVKDNGIGIDPAFSERIFTIFQRLHGRGEYQGTGIGLAVAKKAVERAGGTIWVESQPDEGSTFVFTLIDRELIDDEAHDDKKDEFSAAS